MEDKIRNLDLITSKHKILSAHFANGANIETDIPIVTGKEKWQNPVSEDLLGHFIPLTERKAITTDVEFLKKRLNIPAFLAAGPRAKLRHDPNCVHAAIVVANGLVPGVHSLIHSIVKRHNSYNIGPRGKIFGVYNGLEGLCNIVNNVVELNPSITEEWLDKGGSMLGMGQ